MELFQGRSEGTSSVTFEVLIINCEIDFINLFIFNCLTSNVNLFYFSCLTSNFYFPKNTSFASIRKRLFMDARPWSGETSLTFSARGISLFLLATGRIQKGTKDSDQSNSQRGFHSEAIREPYATTSSCILK